MQGILMSSGHSETFSAPFTFSGGAHQVWAQVDSDDSVDECPFDDNNRLGPVTVTVSGLPNSDQDVSAPPVNDSPRHTPTPAPLMTPTPTATPTRPGG
ncbi:MAG: hypothetical protein IPM76_13555 [Chloroflexi bacterium]|nr:hypothetical protein [Chloroflexota bacterium]